METGAYTLYTIHDTPYTLHPPRLASSLNLIEPYTLHPTPYTLYLARLEGGVADRPVSAIVPRR